MHVIRDQVSPLAEASLNHLIERHSSVAFHTTYSKTITFTFTLHLHLRISSPQSNMNHSRPVRPSAGQDSTMYDDDLRQEDYYRGPSSSQGYQNSRQGKR